MPASTLFGCGRSSRQRQRTPVGFGRREDGGEQRAKSIHNPGVIHQDVQLVSEGWRLSRHQLQQPVASRNLHLGASRPGQGWTPKRLNLHWLQLRGLVCVQLSKPVFRYIESCSADSGPAGLLARLPSPAEKNRSRSLELAQLGASPASSRSCDGTRAAAGRKRGLQAGGLLHPVEREGYRQAIASLMFAAAAVRQRCHRSRQGVEQVNPPQGAGGACSRLCT